MSKIYFIDFVDYQDENIFVTNLISNNISCKKEK